MKPTALVTGASAGIGEAIAKELGKTHDLVLVARSKDKLEALAQNLHGTQGTQSQVIVCDLSQPGSHTALVQELEARNITIDVLVNNAGIGDYGEFANSNQSRILEIMQLNMVALTMLTRALLPAMLARKHGQIVQVASTAAFLPGPLMAVYYASKAFVLSFGEALDEELRGSGVRVLTLCPGPTTTDFQATAAMQDSKLITNPSSPPMTSEAVAVALVAGMQQGKRVVIPGFMNQILALTSRFLPRALVPGIVKNIQARKT